MNQLIYFPIFPEGSLAHSLITTVWVGIMVVTLLNLRYGWVLSGLVVPGYLTPLLLVKPLSVWIIGVESIVVYFLVYIFGKQGVKYGLWGSFFGRDRFFATLLFSVLVKILFDSILLPFIGEWYVIYSGDILDYKNNLHSFGLIVVALIANIFWKPGIVRGLPPTVIIIAITYVIIRFILIEYTNFSLSNLNYMYEDFSSNMLASPKSYIIILITAFIASKMNLKYGWDFNGILVPALLALQWYQPSKIFMSFLEGFIIYFLAILIQKLPIFKKMNIEGGRKIILFFNIGFVYKIFLSYFIIHFFPEVKISDYFAFGYLLSTLIAIKMYDKDIVTHFIRATSQTSFVSIIIASIIGFSLTIGSNFILSNKDNRPNQKVILNIQNIESLNKYMFNKKIKLYENMRPQSFVQPTSHQLNLFSIQIKKLLLINDIQKAKEILSILDTIGIKSVIAEDRYVILEDGNKMGWGIYVVDIKNRSNLLIATPAPLDELGSFESGLLMFKTMNAKGFMVAGTKRKINLAGVSDVLKNRFTLFYKFYEAFNKDNLVLIRGYTQSNLKKMYEKEYIDIKLDNLNRKNLVFINRDIPDNVNLKLLKKLVKNIDFYWESPPTKHIINSDTHKKYIEIYFSKKSIRYMLANFFKIDKIEYQKTYQKIDGYLKEWFLENKKDIAKKSTKKYIQPSISELLYFDNEVLKPIFDFAFQVKDFSIGLTKDDKNILNSIATSASIVNYKLIYYHHTEPKQRYLILQENYNKKKYRGTFVIRLGIASSYMIQVPRPFFEKNSFEFALSLFESLKAKAMVISGRYPFSNYKNNSDMVLASNKNSFYNLFNQVLLREIGDSEFLTLSCRGFGNRNYAPTPKEDLLLAFNQRYLTKDELSPLASEFYNFLEKQKLNIALADGTKSRAGYEMTNTPQSLYLPQTKNKEFAFVWLSSKVRSMYKQRKLESLTLSLMQSLGIKIVETSFEKWLKNINFKEAKKETIKDLKQYMVTKDPIILLNLKKNELKIIYDLESKRIFLVHIKDKYVTSILKIQDSIDNSVIEFKENDKKELILDWIYSTKSILKVVK